MTNKKINILLYLLLVCLIISSCSGLSEPSGEVPEPGDEVTEPSDEEIERERIIAAIKAGGDVVLPEDLSDYACGFLVQLIREAKPDERPITSIKLPPNFDYVGGGEIDTLVNYYVYENDPKYISVDGVIYTKDKSVLVRFPRGRTGEFTIPDTTTYLYQHAFAGTKLSYVYIPDSVSIIGFCCFEALTNTITLEKISLPKGIGGLDGCFPSYFIGSTDGLPNYARQLKENIIIEYRGTYEEWQKDKRHIDVIIPDSQVICTDFDGTKK